MKIFAAVNMNWGLHGPYDWDKTEYSVFDDGRIEQTIYTGTVDQKKETSVSQMSPEFLRQFKELLELFNTYQPDITVQACDGEGWIMKTLGPHGKIIKSYDGYIYGLKVLEDIASYLP